MYDDDNDDDDDDTAIFCLSCFTRSFQLWRSTEQRTIDASIATTQCMHVGLQARLDGIVSARPSTRLLV